MVSRHIIAPEPMLPQLVFFGAAQTNVLNGSSVLLIVNLTNVDPTPINVSVQAIVNEANNQTLEVVNSSSTSLLASVPTLVNTTIANLIPCTNYSMTLSVHSTAGAIVAPMHTIWTFPCEVYSNALTLVSTLRVVHGCHTVCVNATFTNNLDSIVKGEIFAVFHTQTGQTACVCTAPIDIASGGTTNTHIPAVGLTSGTYNATVFVRDSNGDSISQTFYVQG